MLSGMTRGVMKQTTWKVITDLTRVVSPMVVMFWPSYVVNLLATLSIRYCRSSSLSCQVERGNPKYHNWKEALFADRMWVICSKSR